MLQPLVDDMKTLEASGINLWRKKSQGTMNSYHSSLEKKFAPHALRGFFAMGYSRKTKLGRRAGGGWGYLFLKNTGISRFTTLPLEIFTISFFTTIFSPLENLQSCVIVCHPLEILR